VQPTGLQLIRVDRLGELARALPSCKRSLLSVDVVVGMYDSIVYPC